jgi:hypothetical protein
VEARRDSFLPYLAASSRGGKKRGESQLSPTQLVGFTIFCPETKKNIFTANIFLNLNFGQEKKVLIKLQK